MIPGAIRAALAPLASSGEAATRLLGAGVLSRGASLFTLVLLAYLLGPEPFAPYALYLSAVTLLWVAVCGRYDYAIVAARDADGARALARLCRAVGMGVVGLTAAVALPMATGAGEAVPAVVALPFGLAARMVLRIETQLAARTGDHGAIAGSTLATTAVQGPFILAIWLLGASPLAALAAGDVIGHAAAAALVHRRRTPLPAARELSTLAQTAAQWRTTFVYGLPSALASVGFAASPGLFLPLALDAVTAGQLMIALRVVDAVVHLIGGVATPLMQHRLQGDAGYHSAAPLVAMLAAAAATVLVGLGLVAWLVSPLLAGTRWSSMLAFVPWLAAYGIGLAVAGPLVDVSPFWRLERASFVVHAATLAAVAGPAWLAFDGAGPQAASAALGAVSLLRAGLVAALVLRAARERAGPP